MLFEQIIEFDLRGPGLCNPICTVTPKTGYFHGKTKMSKATLRVICNLLLTIFQ